MSTDGSRRLYAISGLQKGKQYQVKMMMMMMVKMMLMMMMMY